jgi:flagellin
MTRINTNVSSLTAQQSLAKSNEQLQTALTRLSTGLRINSGKDDPAGLIASEMLRSDIVSTQKAIGNTQRANQMIATADSALGQISSLLNDIRGLVTEAANSGAVSPDQIAANQLQVDSSLESINRIAQTTSFQGRKLLDGSLGFTTSTADANMAHVSNLKINQAILSGADMDQDVTVRVASLGAAGNVYGTVGVAGTAASTQFNLAGGTFIVTAVVAGENMNNTTVRFVRDANIAAGSPVAIYDSTNKVLTIGIHNDAVETVANIKAQVEAIGGAGTTFAVSGTAVNVAVGDGSPSQAMAGGTTAGGITGDLVLQITGNKGSQVIKFDSGTSGAQIAAAVNGLSNATGVTATYGVGVATKLSFSSAAVGSKQFVDVQIVSQGAGGVFALNGGVTRDYGTDAVATINGYAATADGNNISLNNAMLSMAADLDSTTPTATNIEFTITGGGALFQIGPEVMVSQQIRMGIDAMNTGTLGGSSGKLYAVGSGNDASLTADPTTAADIVDQAINVVTTTRGRLGAFQKTALQSNANALGDTLTALTDAESSVRDADFAAETANLTRAQILVQSGTAVLQIANKNPSNVLALLR